MKGIILAEDQGLPRLYPLTRRVTQQLLPVFDKPVIYYALSTLMLAGIREVQIVGSPSNLPDLQACLEDGRQWGMTFSYRSAGRPGLFNALLDSADFIGNSPVALTQGHHIFHGRDLVDLLQAYAGIQAGAGIFAYSVREPTRYTVVQVDANDRPLHLEDRPARPRSSYAVPELYFFDGSALAKAASLAACPDLGMTALHRLYMDEGTLQVIILGRGIAWLDAGTPESLLQAANFVQVVEERQGFMIACPEEIAYRMGFIEAAHLRALARACAPNAYSDYLLRILDDPQP